RKLAGLVLLSGYFGHSGPTADFLLKTGSRLLKLIPRDLRHAVLEVSNQKPQLDGVRAALTRLRTPVHVVHGDRDDFAPIEIAEALVAETRARRPIRFERVPGADHFLNDGPVDVLLAALEACLPKPRFRLAWPQLPALQWPWARPAQSASPSAELA
ncbi:MAG TPA: hypothetical protein PLV04_08065, partial [Phenylobacterium sp.]|nr:hypothetical protein [Phenylobacterium sp.]